MGHQSLCMDVVEEFDDERMRSKIQELGRALLLDDEDDKTIGTDQLMETDNEWSLPKRKRAASRLLICRLQLSCK
ncbi:hypothetical protein Bca101_054296 [Brassica carinata]